MPPSHISQESDSLNPIVACLEVERLPFLLARMQKGKGHELFRFEVREVLKLQTCAGECGICPPCTGEVLLLTARLSLRPPTDSHTCRWGPHDLGRSYTGATPCIGRTANSRCCCCRAGAALLYESQLSEKQSPLWTSRTYGSQDGNFNEGLLRYIAVITIECETCKLQCLKTPPYLQIGYHFQSLLNSVFPPLIYEAARCLLAICSLKNASSVADLAIATAWAPLAVASLTQLWQRDTGPSAAASHTQLLDLIASNFRSLPVRPCHSQGLITARPFKGDK